MADAGSRWSNDRLDDLAHLARKSDERLDQLQTIVAAHDLQLSEQDRRDRLRSEQQFSVRIAMLTIVLTVVLGEVATVITILLTHH